MGFVFAWMLFSIIPAVVASNKGRSAAGWFFLSLLISPLFAGILVACLPAEKQTLEQRALEDDMRKCPHCAELVKREAKICRYCQRDLPDVVIQVSQEEEHFTKLFHVIERPDKCALCGSGLVETRGANRVTCQKCGSAYQFA